MIHLPLKVTEFYELGGLIRINVESCLNKFSQQMKLSVFNQLSYKLDLLKQPILRVRCITFPLATRVYPDFVNNLFL